MNTINNKIITKLFTILVKSGRQNIKCIVIILTKIISTFGRYY